MLELLKNENIVWGVMSVIVLLLSQIIKLPVKAITKRTIKNENARSRVNTILMLIPLALGIVADYLFCTLYLKVAFDIVEGIKIGGTAITAYGMIEKLIKGSKSKETVSTLDLVDTILKDGKVDEKDGSKVKEFIDTYSVK